MRVFREILTSSNGIADDFDRTIGDNTAVPYFVEFIGVSAIANQQVLAGRFYPRFY